MQNLTTKTSTFQLHRIIKLSFQLTAKFAFMNPRKNSGGIDVFFFNPFHATNLF